MVMGESGGGGGCLAGPILFQTETLNEQLRIIMLNRLEASHLLILSSIHSSFRDRKALLLPLFGAIVHIRDAHQNSSLPQSMFANNERDEWIEISDDHPPPSCTPIPLADLISCSHFMPPYFNLSSFHIIHSFIHFVFV